jgi:hypothetical protein
LFAGAKITFVATNFNQSLIKRREPGDVEVLIYLTI